jgi:hypothetical protein
MPVATRDRNERSRAGGGDIRLRQSFRLQIAECGLQSAECRLQSARCEWLPLGCEAVHLRQPTRAAVAEMICGYANLQSRELQSAICNPQSAIRNLQSAICNLHSAICTLQSALSF